MIIGIPLRNLNKKTALKFPERCVNCGRPKETTLGLSLDLGQQAKIPNLQLKVPMCNVCAEKERGIARVTLVPFLAAGLLVGVLIFVPVTLLSPEGTTSRTTSMPLVLGGAAGLIAGAIGGTLVEFVVKMLATPFYGKLLTRRPLTIFSMFTAQDHLMGIAAWLAREEKTVKLNFENEEIAREFAQLNPQETS